MAECIVASLICGVLSASGFFGARKERRPIRMWGCVALFVICLAVVATCLASGEWDR